MQHNYDGEVRAIADTTYPSAESVIKALNESGQPLAPIKAVSALTPFVYAPYYFWDKIEPEYGDVLPDFETVPDTLPSVARKTPKGLIIPLGGINPSHGSYFETFAPIWAPEAGLSKLCIRQMT